MEHADPPEIFAGLAAERKAARTAMLETTNSFQALRAELEILKVQVREVPARVREVNEEAIKRLDQALRRKD